MATIFSSNVYSAGQALAESAKLLRAALRPFFDPTVYGRKPRGRDIYLPNTQARPFPLRSHKGKMSINVPDTLTKLDFVDHLRANNTRYYLTNKTQEQVTRDKASVTLKAFRHLLCLDIDSDNFCDARELAADIVLRDFADLRVPPLILPSTSGTGAHVWFVVQRFHRTLPRTFNVLMDRFSNVLKVLHPATKETSLAWIDHVKGQLWFDEPNPVYDPYWASAWAEYDMNYLRPSKNKTGYTMRECYDLQKRFSEKHRYEPDLEITVRRMSQHALIAFPCAGRPDLVPTFLAWLHEASKDPIPESFFNRVLQSNPVSVQILKALEVQREDQQWLDSLSKITESERVLMTIHAKPQATMAAAQVGLQRHGFSVTHEQVMEIYQQEAVTCSGGPTAKRHRRIRSALQKAKARYNTNYARGHAQPGVMHRVPHEPKISDIVQVAKCMELMPVQWDELAMAITGKGRPRKPDAWHMAAVYCAYRFCLAYRADGSVDGTTIKALCRELGICPNGGALKAYREELVRLNLLHCVDRTFTPSVVVDGKVIKRGRGMKWRVGHHRPSTPWLEYINTQDALLLHPAATACTMADAEADIASCYAPASTFTIVDWSSIDLLYSDGVTADLLYFDRVSVAAWAQAQAGTRRAYLPLPQEDMDKLLKGCGTALYGYTTLFFDDEYYPRHELCYAGHECYAGHDQCFARHVLNEHEEIGPASGSQPEVIPIDKRVAVHTGDTTVVK